MGFSLEVFLIPESCKKSF